MDDYLAHHGVKGQKWGVRRYQNPDGTYTDAGKKRRNTYNRDRKELKKSANKYISEGVEAARQLMNYEKKHNLGYDEIYKSKKPSKILDERSRLEDYAFRVQSTADDNENFYQFRKNSQNYIEKYGHKKYRDVVGDDANLYYTEEWLRCNYDNLDKDWNGFRYRNLSEELWW